MYKNTKESSIHITKYYLEDTGTALILYLQGRPTFKISCASLRRSCFDTHCRPRHRDDNQNNAFEEVVIVCPVYTIQPDNRLYRVDKHPTGCQTGCQNGLTTGLTTGCIV